MRTILLITAFLVFTQSFGQREELINTQNQWFIKAKESLNNENLWGAYSAFYFSYSYYPESKIGQTSLAKFDSIQIILRENLKSKMQGLWKVKFYKQTKNPGDIEHFYKNLPGKFLEITHDSLNYFASKLDRRINSSLYSDLINFCDLQTHFPAYNHIIHNDQNLWSYRVSDNGKELYVSRAGKLISNDERTGPSSHPMGYKYIKIK